ncbi:MAG: hypothetical protein V7K50_22990 [Nostoc sp.]|uniref:hypothetical protein n=1 Tax=Nostoc sp. TaxID=1180 RepID=UPI002FF457C0
MGKGSVEIGWCWEDVKAKILTLRLAPVVVYLATLADGGAQGLFFAEIRKFGSLIQLQW